MSKLIIPHVHKTLGGAGFFSKISETGKVEDIRVNVLEGLRQIEGILIGRRVFETPLVISRICGICPTSHILNACRSLESTLEVKVSHQTEKLRKLIASAQIIQSHSAHLFFMSLADFFNIDDEEKLTQKFSRETNAILELRDFSLKIIEVVGGRTVHPMTFRVGGFTKNPDLLKLKSILKDYNRAHKAGLSLVNLFQKVEYPELKRETVFASSYNQREYPYSLGHKIKIGHEIFSAKDFFFNQVEEDLKNPPTKRVTYKGKPYMPGAIARVRNNESLLNEEAKLLLNDFYDKKKITEEEFFANNFHNSYCQAIEIIHLLEEIKKDIEFLSKSRFQDPYVEYREKKGAGLALLEAPRGILLSQLETGKDGRISNCSIITPTAQFLRNLEEDLKVMIPQISNLSKKRKIRRIKTLIRAYDPCIACAVH